MYNYQLIEFSSYKKIHTVTTDTTILEDVLSEAYGNRIESMFNDNGESKGYVSLFINSKQISSIKNITLDPHDEICIVTSISGG